MRRLPGVLNGIGLLALLVGAWLVLTQRELPGGPTGQLVVSPIETPEATISIPTTVVPTLDPLMTYEPPTTTPVPIPTSTATPVVTPIPMAKPPFIPLPIDIASKPLTLVYGTNNSIRSVDSDGSSERMIASLDAQTTGVLPGDGAINGDISPDGQYLAFVLSTSSETSEAKDASLSRLSIHLLDLHTGSISLLLADSYAPLWSPDGTQIAYVSATTGALHVANVATAETRLVYQVDKEAEHLVTDLDWSPDSKRLTFIDKVFRQSSSIIVVDVEGNEPAQQIGPDSLYLSRFPTWSPTDERIAYISNANEIAESSGSTYSLWIVNPDGTNNKQVTHQVDVIGGAPQWSPDGEWIAFAGTPLHVPGALYDLWITDRIGSTLKRLGPDAMNLTNESIRAWSFDGTWIVFVRDMKELWSLSLTDGGQHKLPVDTTDALIIQSDGKE